MQTIKVFFDNGRGLKVTERTLSAPLRIEDINHLRQLRIGREPLYLAVVLCVPLLLCTVRFNALLYPHEQFAIVALCSLVLSLGFAIRPLIIGTLFGKEVFCWGDLWTLKKVMKALDAVKEIDGVKR